MTYDEFLGQVQNRARLASREEAVAATRATLEAFGRRLSGGELNDVASQLPSEIQLYLGTEGPGERFDLKEFYNRVSILEGKDIRDAAFHARVVLSVLKDAINENELQDMLAQLPDQFRSLFEEGAENLPKAA